MDDVIVHSIKKPISIDEMVSLNHAAKLMYEKKVWDLSIISNNRFVGLLHMHSITKAFLD